MKLASQALLGALTCSCLQAATNVSYTSSASPDSNPDGNSGAVDVWSTSTLGGGSKGFFQGSSANNGGSGSSGAGAGTSAWAMYASGGGEAFASHTFAGGALSQGQAVSLAFDHGLIDTDKSTGIQLFSGSTLLFQFYFRGNQTKYEFFDAGGWDQDTTENYTADGGIFSLTLTGNTSYTASYRGASWTGSIGSILTNPIDRIQVYNNSAGSGSNHDVFFNNLSVVPEPTNALAGLLAGIGLLMRKRRHG